MTSSVSAKMKPAKATVLWEDIPEGDSQEFDKARVETLNITQWLARIANSYVSRMAPEERVILEFRAGNPAFITQAFASDVRLELRLENLEMQFLEHGRAVPHIFDPEDHSPAKVEAWLLVELLHRGIERSKFSKKLPYAVQNLMTGDAEDHSPQACLNGLARVATWYRNASSVLSFASHGSKILLLPQTLTLTYEANGVPEVSRGFSIGDENAGPHFFVKGRGAKVLEAAELVNESEPGLAAAQFIAAA